jgi:hypothetical protein
MTAFTLLATVAILATPASAEELAFEDGAAVITGEVLKPEVTVVISRENLNKNYELELKESFLQKIIDSVEQPPF